MRRHRGRVGLGYCGRGQAHTAQEGHGQGTPRTETQRDEPCWRAAKPEIQPDPTIKGPHALGRGAHPPGSAFNLLSLCRSSASLLQQNWGAGLAFCSPAPPPCPLTVGDVDDALLHHQGGHGPAALQHRHHLVVGAVPAGTESSEDTAAFIYPGKTSCCCSEPEGLGPTEIPWILPLFAWFSLCCTGRSPRGRAWMLPQEFFPTKE